MIPDWKCTSTPKAAEVTERDTAQWAQKLVSFYNEDMLNGEGSSESDDAEASDKDAPEIHLPKRRLVANMIHLRALDAALTNGIGRPLSDFVHHNPPQPLRDGQKRRLDPINEISGHPPEIEQLPQGVVRKRCVITADDGTDPYIETANMRCQATLHQVPDQGPVGWYALFWMYCHAGIHGWFASDPHHRCWNDTKLALKDAGIWLAVLEVALAVNMPAGPYDGASWFHQMSTAAQRFTASTTHEDPLFQASYDAISLDLGSGILPEDHGTLSHENTVHNAVPRMEVFQNKGSKVKMCRWFNWFEGAKRLLSCWHVMVMILTFFLVQDGVIRTAMQLVCRSDIEAKILQIREARAKAKAAPNTTASRQVRHSNVEVDALRAASKNQMHLAARIMANERVYHITVIAVELTQPLRTTHGLTVKKLHTPAGRVDFHTSHYLGTYNTELRWVVGAMSSPTLLSRCDFTEPPSAAIAALETHSWDHYPMADENELANCVVRLMRELISHRGLNCLDLERNVPGVFLGLLLDDAAQRESCLARLHHLWDSLHFVERTALTNTTCRSFLRRLVWPCSSWIRGLFLSLLEYDWKFIPEWVVGEIKAWASAVKTTELEEIFFNKLRDHERHSKANILGPLSSWVYMVGCKEIESFGLAGPRPTIDTEQFKSDHKTANRLRASTFKHNLKPFSLGEELLATVTGKQTWPSLSPKRWAETVICTDLLQAAFNANSVAMIEGCWKNSLASAGWVLRPRSGEERQCLYVVRVTAHGLLVWPAIREPRRGDAPLIFRLDPDGRLDTLFIQDYDDWSALSVRGQSAISLCHKLQEPDRYRLPVQVYITGPDGAAAHSLKKVAARHGFPNLTITSLRKLATSEGMRFTKQTRPSNKAQWLRALLIQILGDLPEDELQHLMALGNCRKPVAIHESELLNPDHAPMVEEGFDEADVKDVKKDIKSALKQRGAAQSSRAGGSASSSGHAPSGLPASPSASSAPAASPAAPPPAPAPRPPCFTPDWMKEYMPVIVGCTVRLDTRKNRFQVEYPRDVPPFSKTFTFGSKATQRQTCLAFVDAAEWAWQEHLARMPNQECPHDFDSMRTHDVPM